MSNDRLNKPGKPKTPQTHKKVFDVMRPGKAPASPTSRPVIVGHKPPVADDQFVPTPHQRIMHDPSEKRPLMDPDKKIGLTPLPGTEESAHVEPSETKPVPDPGPPAEADIEKAAAELLTEQPAKKSSEAPDVFEASSTPDTTLPPENPLSSMPTAAINEAKPTPEQLAVGQTVDLPADASNDSGISKTPGATKSSPSPASVFPMTQDDVLAETDAPLIEQAFVSHHKHRTGPLKALLIFTLVLLLVLAAFDFLLDAEVLTTDLNIPHTNIL